MTITLYHCDGSRSMRPMWAMEEMGIDYELVTMRFPARDHHKEFKAINPLGTVPHFAVSNWQLIRESDCFSASAAGCVGKKYKEC